MERKQKKILILGVGEAQRNLIQASLNQGYYVIVCDLREDREGAKLANKYYKVDYMDRKAVLEIAQRENIDGVISNSEPAMLNVAYIAEQLGLPGNSMESIETLLSKGKFRELQKKVGVYSPKHYVASSFDELVQYANKINYPVIIKPTESSGTRGTEKFNFFDEKEWKRAYEICHSFSRNGLVTLEEYVEMRSLTVNDADVFVIGDEIIWDGWLWENRSKDMPMLPMTEVFPMALSKEKKDKIRDIVEKILRGSGVKLGEYNVETYDTLTDEIFVIEINPRQAGNHIPQLIEQHTGVDLTRLLVSTAVGDMSYYEHLKTYQRENNFVTLQVVFSKRDGIFERLYISPKIEGYVKWIDITVKQGDMVERGINAEQAVAYVDLLFPDYETQHLFTDRIEKYIYPILKNDF